MVIKGAGYDVNFFINIRPAKEGGAVRGAAKPTPFSEALPGRTDTIQISKRPESDGLLNGVKEKIMGEIRRDADPDDLKALKNEITDGTYTVNPAELAGILAE
ncbi:MAG: flagellar biosynthesis anti-sigma factor FlgM [Oscillospiraceae bacterium]|jgi:anti-sigma28 factor (negative regulator of flagellin synthesis)|nr:flagellar biosynthesis anti-sigma factor FlgM [Oscillospiraceae bacterium]MCI1990355.1 flagellar biosynthesis anti-sigma factor FlgM [Oscillospiraceae bacterium]MCI2034460.1 flagellar biosynthesis anti-sigma factor FlgM [Oscillospiraceae bacterium]